MDWNSGGTNWDDGCGVPDACRRRPSSGGAEDDRDTGAGRRANDIGNAGSELVTAYAAHQPTHYLAHQPPAHQPTTTQLTGYLARSKGLNGGIANPVAWRRMV